MDVVAFQAFGPEDCFCFGGGDIGGGGADDYRNRRSCVDVADVSDCELPGVYRPGALGPGDAEYRAGSPELAFQLDLPFWEPVRLCLCHGNYPSAGLLASFGRPSFSLRSLISSEACSKLSFSTSHFIRPSPSGFIGRLYAVATWW